MKKLATTGLPGRYLLVLMTLLVVSTFWNSHAAAQGCIMTCPFNSPPVVVSLPAGCVDTLTYDEIGVTITGCTGDIIVDIMENGTSLGNVVDTSMIGNSYMVVVSNPASGQSCMTVIIIEDNQAPIINCPADVTLSCTTDLSLYSGLSAADISDCSPTSFYFEDLLLSISDCEDSIIADYARVYYVLDSFNNIDSCEQLISLAKANLSEVVFPSDLTGISALPCFPLPDTSPVNTGIPSVGGSPITNGAVCNLSVIYNDQVVPICSGSYKIFRTFTVYDWCENNLSIDSTQIIEVLDVTPPVVQAPPDVTISAASTACTASYNIPAAIITDDCATIWTVRMQGPFGTIHSNGGFIQGLPLGVHIIDFIATSDCNLEGIGSMTITVQDLQPPVPVCNQTLAIPLDNTGTAIIPATAFNAASQDNCGSVFFKVKRMSLPVGYECANPGNEQNMFDDFIQFCCEDIANNNIMVILRVYDQQPIPGPVSDTYLAGHFNDCMVVVEVQDKLSPQITCPDDLTVSCEFLYTMDNLDVFGSVVVSPATPELICIDDPGFPGNPGLQCIGVDGVASDNCNVTISTTASVNINSCGVGTITRTFIATDDGGRQASCQQVINIVNYDLFDLSDITWPADYTVNNICDISLLDPEDLLPPYDFPVLNEGPCDLAAATYDDMVFDFSNADQACFKILRTWTVIDWCQINTPAGGTWTHIQVIKVMNNVAPVIAPFEDIVTCSFDTACIGITLPFEASATDDCSGPATLTWRYRIDENNDGSYEFISALITGSSVEFTRLIPIGEHRILYSVTDQCGNTSIEEQLITVESCLQPSAKCIHGLSTNLMAMDLNGDGQPDWGMVTIQAEMFDAGSDHPCGNAVTVAFSADPLDVSRVFDCNDLGDNEIELWAIDENGLTDFCITTIEIQDNNNVCPPENGITGIISGNISVPGSGKLAGAMIYLEGSNQAPIPSAANGYYVFPSMPLGGNYSIRPERNGDAKNGVTTLDLVKIQKHLLGLQHFTTPYEFIAADANNSKSVTAIDIIQLRRLILGYDTAFSNNASWRFIDKAYVFPNPANPWLSAWPETYSIQPFNNSMNDVDFDAIKVGDVNLSASLHASNNIILPRTNGECTVEYSITTEKEDNLLRVDIHLTEAEVYNAIQFSFNWDHASFQLIDWAPGDGISAEDVRLHSVGDLSTSIATYDSDGWEPGARLLLSIWVKKTTPSGNFKLYLRPEPTAPVAYTVFDETALNINLVRKAQEIHGITNRPNPFKDLTTIYFKSDRIDQASLKIYDMNAKLVYTRKVNLNIGENEFILTRSELKGPGLYVYEIASPFQHSTNRMIIVD